MTTSPSTVRLSGAWRQGARALWLVSAVAALAILILSYPLFADQTLVTCALPPCDFGAFSPRGLAALQALGFSPPMLVLVSATATGLAALVYLFLGALLFWVKSDEPFFLFVSWVMLFSGLVDVQANLLLRKYPAWAGPLVLISALTYVGYYLLLFVFPNGRFVPRWSRYLSVPIVLTQAVISFFPSRINLDLILPISGGWFLVGLGAQIYRYQRVANVTERQQTKWVVASLIASTIFFVNIILPALFPAAFSMPGAGLSTPGDFVMWHMFIPFVGTLFPLALTLSILRLRLWDIDFVINRSLVYGGLTAALVVVFAGMLWLVSLVAQGQAFLIAFGLTAVLGGAFFQPARRRLQRFIDRRFYHIEIDYQKTPAAARPTSTFVPHTFGPYGGLELIGRGGMGEVYRAQHPTLNRMVALKLLPIMLAAEGDFRQRFQREAKTLAALQHPNIIQVFESGEVNGIAYMAMEYLAGQDLAAHLRARGRLPFSEALPILTAIASALDYAHAQGLVHRDIKPSNVMLETQSGHARPVLMDFGIAKILGRTVMTQTGGVLGTFDYIAPEQIQGAAEVDGRADVYAFGVTVYQMLTGELPFKHHNPGALLIAHLTQPAPDPREVAPDLSRDTAHALQRALAKSPVERYPTAGEFVAALK